RTAVVLVASLLAVAGLGGCGSSSSSRPGCSSFCQQAGASAGDESGINTPAPGCPPLGSGASIHYCIEQVGSTAVARKGVFRIGVRCNSAAPCVGPFVVYSERDLTIKGRFAGSDFRVSPKTTATIEVALTKVGEE